MYHHDDGANKSASFHHSPPGDMIHEEQCHVAYIRSHDCRTSPLKSRSREVWVLNEALLIHMTPFLSVSSGFGSDTRWRCSLCRSILWRLRGSQAALAETNWVRREPRAPRDSPVRVCGCDSRVPPHVAYLQRGPSYAAPGLAA